MIDLHTHILPEMDDGSQSVEESTQMLRLCEQQGVDILGLTPHFYPWRESPERFLQRRQEALEKLPETFLRLLVGAEVAYFNGISRCDELSDLRLGETGTILVEMPFAEWSGAVIEDVCAIHRRQGLTPILAHIERYRAFPGYREAVRELLSADVRMQCNAQTLLHPLLGRVWIKKVRQGEIHFLGSDCHNTNNRPPNLQAAMRRLEKSVGSQSLREWDAAARALLQPNKGYCK